MGKALNKKIVLALGGNAIITSGQEGNIYQQFANTRKSLEGILELIRQDFQIVLTHGNGPQVGNYLIRVEEGRHLVPEIPLGVIVADTQGGIGYMIQQQLKNKLIRHGIERDLVTVVTQVIVDPADPNIADPTKFVGPFLSENNLQRLQDERGWIIKEDPGRGFRRVVASPEPIDIVETKTIIQLLENGHIVIACGGGGIPVYYDADGMLEGLDAVIDKDKASAVLASKIGAEQLLILTGVEKVCLNYNKPNQVELDQIRLDEAETLLKQGHFPKGSMGPKIEAAISFLKNGGEKVVITSMEKSAEAALGKAGTTIRK
jgi:carbamate kinase